MNRMRHCQGNKTCIEGIEGFKWGNSTHNLLSINYGIQKKTKYAKNVTQI